MTIPTVVPGMVALVFLLNTMVTQGCLGHWTILCVSISLQGHSTPLSARRWAQFGGPEIMKTYVMASVASCSIGAGHQGVADVAIRVLRRVG